MESDTAATIGARQEPDPKPSTDAPDEVLDGGVDFLRGLWPKAKFIFHARRNLTRVAASDFWRDADACECAHLGWLALRLPMRAKS